MIDLLDKHSFVKINEPNIEEIEAITIAARKHLATFLGVAHIEQFDAFLRYALVPDAAEDELLRGPDGLEEIQIGQAWLYTAPDHKSLLDRLQKKGCSRSDLSSSHFSLSCLCGCS